LSDAQRDPSPAAGDTHNELPLHEWMKTPEAEAMILEMVQARLRSDYVPTPLERAFEEAGREFFLRLEINRAAEPVLLPYPARAGWFLFGRFPSKDIGVLAEHVRSGEAQAANAMMANFARGEVDPVEREVTDAWPTRAPILHQAFEAHRAEQYALSIPVFLAQADGIAYETLGQSLFGTKHGAPATRQAYRVRLEDRVDPERHPWAMLFGPLELLCSWRERVDDWRSGLIADPSYGGLNRHAILHGLDLNYPSEENSLRAILLLAYVDAVREWFRKP
jgi:hypothetical protein